MLTRVDIALLQRFATLLPADSCGAGTADLIEAVLTSIGHEDEVMHPRAGEVVERIKSLLESGWRPERPKPPGFDDRPHLTSRREWF